MWAVALAPQAVEYASANRANASGGRSLDAQQQPGGGSRKISVMVGGEGLLTLEVCDRDA